MITYPSTSGVFEDNIKEVCDMVHHYGGQVRNNSNNLSVDLPACLPVSVCVLFLLNVS